MLGHADLKQTQRYLNVTDEERRRVMAAVWERRRGTKGVGVRLALAAEVSAKCQPRMKTWRARQDSNLRPSA